MKKSNKTKKSKYQKKIKIAENDFENVVKILLKTGSGKKQVEKKKD